MDSQQPVSASVNKAPGTPEMRAVLCADLVDSTALVERMGDIPGADLMRRHDRIARDLLQRHGGQEIDKTDGFLLLFGRALDAVAFALAYQRALAELSRDVGQTVQARVGIHLGEVILWQNMASDVAQGAKPTEVEGLAKPVAARLMGLARPAQILLSGAAFNLAQRASGELPGFGSAVRWLTHGRYQFKGMPQPQLVHEVGEPDIAPLRAPASGPKARRDAPLWRRPMALLIEAVAAAAVLAIALVVLLRPTPVIAFAERDWVVLGDLQNRTSEPNFSGALDAALRIGLEQSRFVNVVPNLQVQDALRRMEKPGEAVDRDVGVELALREGARALLLPTVSEVGRGLRFNLEVVDPNSGATVRVESADAAQASDLLPAMDQTLASLRTSLGESIKDINQNSAPLVQITTGNLEALRAFSQVELATAAGKVDEGIALLQMAIELDPGFAMAHAMLGSALISYRRQFTEGVQELDRAVQLAERLSMKERATIEAVRAHYLNAPDTVEKWGVLARLYPDFVGARHNLGLQLAFWRNEPGQAIEHFEFAAQSSHPRRAESVVALAQAHLLLGQTSEAEQQVERGRALLGGRSIPLAQDCLVDLALGRHDVVLQRLDELLAQAPARVVPEHLLLRAAVHIERGDLQKATEVLEEAAGVAEGRSASVIELARLSLDSQRGTLSHEAAQRFIDSQMEKLLESAVTGDRSAELTLPTMALVAQRAGMFELAEKVLAAVEGPAQQNSQRAVVSLIETGRCLQRMASERLACLDDIAAPDYYSTLVAAVEAARATGDQEEVSRRYAHLADAKYRVFAESPFMELLIPNQLDAARLRAASSP